MALNPRQKIIKQDAFKKKPTAQRVLEAEQKRKGIVPVVDQAPTIDPNAPRLGDDRKKGVFTNSAGQTVNSAGRPVEANGKPIADPTVEQPLATYGEIGEANIQAEYDANQATELDLTGATSGYSSMDEYFKDLFASQKENTQLSREQLELQRQQGVETTTDQKNAIMGGVETAQGQLTGSREGVTSGSNQTTLGRYQTVAGQQIQRLQQAQDLSAKAIEQAQVNLDRAERAGNTQLAEQYRSQLLSAESQAQQTETDLINALSSQATTESAIQTENITTFQGLIDEGQELSVETISGFAKKLGIDFDTAYGYYAGVQNIRDDKTLSLEEKEVLLAKEKDNLDKQLRGITTESAKNIDYLNQLRQMGASEEIISAFKSSAGITDYDDPLTQAELAYNQARAKIAYNEANGVIVSPLDMIDLAQKTYDYYSQIGYTAGAVPTGGEYGATPYTLENGLPAIMVNVQQGQSLDVSATTRDEGQCGAFVNDFFGEKMFGDLFEQKMGLVDKSIQVPEPGMAFVMETESPYGHVGVVEYVDPSRGVMGVVDANWSNDGKVQRREIPITSASGFVRAPKSIPADAELTLLDVPEDVRTAVTTKANQFDGEQLVKNFQVIQEGYNYMSSLDPKNLTSSDNQSIIYAFAKIMDPNSVVRESEYETVQRYAQSLASTYGFNAQRLLSNEEFLTEEAINNMVATVQDRYDTSAKSYDNLRSEYARTINNLAGGVNIADSILQNYSTQQEAGVESENLDPFTLADEYDPFTYSLYSEYGIE